MDDETAERRIIQDNFDWPAVSVQAPSDCSFMPPSPGLLVRIAEARALVASLPPGVSAAPLLLEEPRRSETGYNDGVIMPEPSPVVGAAPVAVSQRSRLSGALNVLVVLVDFPGAPWGAAANYFNDLFFSSGVIPTGSVNEYYSDVSGGRVSITGRVVGPYTLSNPLRVRPEGLSRIT